MRITPSFKMFLERAAAQGYEPAMAFLAVLCPSLFHNIVKGVVFCAQKKGYQPSLRDFVDHHGKETSEQDMACLQEIIAKHQEEMGQILLARQIKEASLRDEKAKQPSRFFSVIKLCCWPFSQKEVTDAWSSERDRSPLLKSH
jgi:hypothetical protein